MNKQLLAVTLLWACGIQAEESSEFDAAENLTDLHVEGVLVEGTTTQLLPESSSIMKDTAEVLRKMPGTQVNQNGPLSGIAQYRGMFGTRVNVQAGDTQMVASCSNAMDAAMSHTPASLVDAVILHRGVSPVSQGIETIGGVINIIPKSLNQGNDGFSGQLSVGHATANDGFNAAIQTEYTQDEHTVALGLGTEDGSNYDIPQGTNRFTGLERTYYSLGYEYLGEDSRFSWHSNYNDTGKTGTPALPMDIIYARGGVNELQFEQTFNQIWTVNSTASWQNTDHLMDNFSFRNQTASGKRASYTEVDRQAFSLELIRSKQPSQWLMGLDYDQQDNLADISNPDNDSFNIRNFDTNKERFSLYLLYSQKINEANQISAGIRHTHTDANAGEVFSSVAMMSSPMGQLHRTLQDRFNASDRNKTDHNTDLNLTWLQALNQNIQLEYAFGIKNRAPTHQERYLWLPLEATAGLADGRRYLGNLELDSETAYQAEFGINYQSKAWTFSPHIFFHKVYDYIQGTPNTIMPAPPETLRFNNVDAELYGFDVEWTWQMTDHLSFRNVINYVRGKRTDINDNLYRIAPLNTWINISYQKNKWQWDWDINAAVSQNKVSSTNNETTTPGFGVLHTTLSYAINDASQIKISVNNVFDKLYYHHTNGFNRNNTNSDVGFDPDNLQAFRLPAEGRNILLSYQLDW